MTNNNYKSNDIGNNASNNNTSNNNDNVFIAEIRNDLEANLDKFRDPVVLAEMAFKLMEERENTNRLLKNLYTRIEALELRLSETAGLNELNRVTGSSMPIESHARNMPKISHASSAVSAPLLAEVDEKIMAHIRQIEKATAGDIQKKFGYRGKNGACARLNRLCDAGLLRKKQVGKKIFFFPI